MAQAQAAIDTLESQGVADLEFTNAGEIYYQFAGLKRKLTPALKSPSDSGKKERARTPGRKTPV